MGRDISERNTSLNETSGPGLTPYNCYGEVVSAGKTSKRN